MNEIFESFEKYNEKLAEEIYWRLKDYLRLFEELFIKLRDKINASS